MRRTPLLPCLPLLLLAGPAGAQETTPAAATPAATAPAPTATPVPPVPPPKPMKPLLPKLPPVPESGAAAAPVAERKAILETARSLVEELKAAVEYQTAEARRVETRGRIAENRRAEIARARERGTEHVRMQLARVEKTAGETDARLDAILEEVIALERLSRESAESVSRVLTYDDRTERALQEMARCFAEIAEKAEVVVEEIGALLGEEQVAAFESTFDEERGRKSGKDRVAYGELVHVKAEDVVRDAVVMWSDLKVDGHVTGDAVAMFGSIEVTETGKIDGDAVTVLGDLSVANAGQVMGDAVAVLGRVGVKDGGKVHGEHISIGSGKLLGGLVAARPPAVPVPWPHRFGFGMLKAGAQFLAFFLLGLLALALVPRRLSVISSALQDHPIKSGLFGILASVAFLPFTLLMLILVVTIPLIPFFWAAYPLFAFVGFVALAMLIGRRLPSRVEHTPTAVLALGAAVIVVVGLIPILGKLLWFAAAFFALGATLMTRFGQDRPDAPGTAATNPGDLSSVA